MGGEERPTDEGVSVEVAVLVVVHFDARLVVVDALGDDAETREKSEELVLLGVFGERCNVDGCVDALFGLALLLLCFVLRIQFISNSQTVDDSSTKEKTHILSLSSSLALLGRIKGGFIIVDARHLVCRTLLLRKRFIHLNREKSKKMSGCFTPMAGCRVEKQAALCCFTRKPKPAD